MCGIAAIFSDRSLPEGRRDSMEEMLRRISHRGPDGSGVFAPHERALLGHCRLVIIDREGGDQPMRSPDGRYTLLYNGEIYNRPALRQELLGKGVRLTGYSDTEVLLHLLIEEGERALGRLNGMFAFVFHDRETDRWIVARDHCGIKPLYWCRAGDELLFASEIKTLLAHPQVMPARDDTSLYQYLTFQFCLGNRTLFRDIFKVAPGSFMAGHGASIDHETLYWQAEFEIDDGRSGDDFLDELDSLLEDSARLQLQADVPIGGYLSGGLDSSLVCALAERHAGYRLPAFHGRFAESPAYDESAYAEAAAESIGLELHTTTIQAADFPADLPRLIRALDEPVAGPGVFPQYRVSGLASRHATVVLGGQGGDELFGGYARYLVGYLEQALKGAIWGTQEEGQHVVTLESVIQQLPLLQGYQPLLSHFWSEGLFEPMDARYFRLIDRLPEDALDPALAGDYGRDELFEDFRAIFNAPDALSYINKMTHFDLTTLLPALLHVEDRVSMAHSLEARVPLLDPRIISLVMSIPPRHKFYGGRTKALLRDVAEKHLPTSVLQRTDKMGFPVPLKEWMQGGPVREFVTDILLSERSVQRGIYCRHALNRICNEQGIGGRELWGALCLELWHREFIDGVS